jgi:tryptophan-rich sensory protein
VKKILLHILIAVLICLLVGFLSGFATQTSVNDWYLSLKKPGFTPPNWIFAPVWTVLYIMMGIAAGLISARGYSHNRVKIALYYFGFQLVFNALWSIVFFGFKSPFWGLLVILVLAPLILWTIRWFFVVSKAAAFLLVPYFLWVCFATLLNYRIWELN